METEMSEAPGSPPSLTRRACDQCRLRKIRCDKESPCSNCKSARRSCSSTGAGQKPKEARQRVLISSQYERKIDLIEDRLDGIERLLRQLVSTQGSVGSTPSATTSLTLDVPNIPRASTSPRNQYTSFRNSKGKRGSTSLPDGDTPDTIYEPEGPETFEGNSALSAHAAFASEFLADAVRKTTLHDGGAINPKIDAAVNTLRQIVDMQHRRSEALPQAQLPESGTGVEGWASPPRPLVKTNLRDLPLPSMTIVQEQLTQMRHGPLPVMLATIYAFIDFERFAERCRRLYFKTTTTEDPSDATFIIATVGLGYAFFEASLTATDPAKKAQYAECRDMCYRNLEVVLSQLNLVMPATSENIEALLMAASCCIDLSRASLAWTLVSRAAHMCRTLGYHQLHTMNADSPDTKAGKSLLFWCTYMLDKALALRLGRASVLQDYDISLPHVTPEAKADYPGREIMTLWIQQAQIMGRIYERLYSPGALRQPEATRVEQVRILATEQERLMGETLALLQEFEAPANTNSQGAGVVGGEDNMYAMTLKSDHVSYLSSLALTYRALPPNGPRSRTFADPCIDAARASIRVHLEAIDMMDNENLKICYIHWTILYAPFIPFIVIFCLVVETSDREDLQRLRDFVTSLETACEYSGSVKKLHQLCQVLYNVAEVYIEAKAVQRRQREGLGDSEMGAGDVVDPMGMEFDMYLSQLGFMPVVDDGSGLGGSGGAMPDLGGAASTAGSLPANQLEDWFSGKNYMMGLLEEDLSGMNPTGWASWS
ncbi:fungal-specific transcription factor domain protein [Xylariaceae sp. FL0255]|nr:fungal-specific transcription factor domain protein [Xylariaceae sp. FL0255]